MPKIIKTNTDFSGMEIVELEVENTKHNLELELKPNMYQSSKPIILFNEDVNFSEGR